MDEIEQLIRHGCEERNLEYKASFVWTDQKPTSVQLSVVKSCLAMSNLRDGGTVIIGVKRNGDGSYSLEGMPQADYNSFDSDKVRRFVNRHAVSPIEIHVRRSTLNEGLFVVIQVREFADIPTIASDGREGIQSGQLYTRSKDMPATHLVQHPDEMREILDLAMEKSLAHHSRLAAIAGLVPGIKAEEQFRAERGDL